jgi:hypothetical protein
LGCNRFHSSGLGDWKDNAALKEWEYNAFGGAETEEIQAEDNQSKQAEAAERNKNGTRRSQRSSMARGEVSASQLIEKAVAKQKATAALKEAAKKAETAALKEAAKEAAAKQKATAALKEAAKKAATTALKEAAKEAEAKQEAAKQEKAKQEKARAARKRKRKREKRTQPIKTAGKPANNKQKTAEVVTDEQIEANILSWLNPLKDPYAKPRGKKIAALAALELKSVPKTNIEVEAAYRRASLKYHSDKIPAGFSTSKRELYTEAFKELEKAKELVIKKICE